MEYIIDTFSLGNDQFMRWARMDAQGERKGCVVVGLGWGEWLEKYEEEAEGWSQRDYDCVCVEWRGQGLSSRFLEDRMRGYHKSFDTLIEDFDTFFNWLFASNAGPVLLMGHSMGSHLLLRWYLEKGNAYLEKDSDHKLIKGVILLSLMQRFNTAPYSPQMARLLTTVANAFFCSKRYAPGQKGFDPVNMAFENNHITSDEPRFQKMILALRENPMLKTGGITYGWLNAAYVSAAKLEKRLRRGAPQGPYLLMGPESDPLVDTHAMRQIAALLPNCTTAFIPGTKHELRQEKESVRLETWATIESFIKPLIR